MLYTEWSLVYSEDEFGANSPIIYWHGIGIGSNLCQSMSISCQSLIQANLYQSMPIRGQFFTKTRVCQLSNLCQSQQIQCQSWPIQCQFHAITEAICPFNLGTSPLYGMVPSLLGGRRSCATAPDRHHHMANLEPVLSQSLVNP